MFKKYLLFGSALLLCQASFAQGYFDFDGLPGISANPSVQIDLNPAMLSFVSAAANAADPDKRADILKAMKQRGEEFGKPLKVRVLLHSLAFGTLKPYIAESAAEAINKAQMDMTMDVMANSLVYWTQDLVSHKFLGSGSRIFSMTSAGGARVWKSYGAVSAAKSALESHTRQLALELAPLGITVNSLMAGVTDTPALRKIPGSDEMIAMAQRKNPSNRLTTTQDVAEALGLLSHPKAHWITGNVICIDGGEFIVD